MKWTHPIRMRTSSIRTLPDFIIIGGMKCATTALYFYLAKHPKVIPAVRKEVHFFDSHYSKGLDWYRGHFPFYRNYIPIVSSSKEFITGEASPNYMIYPHAPKRIAETLPKAKLIVVLRNPVDRAYSHYKHQVRVGKETLSFEEAIDREDERIEGELEKMIEDETYVSLKYSLFSYLHRGIYVDQLKAWFNYFKREQILILETENLISEHKEV